MTPETIHSPIVFQIQARLDSNGAILFQQKIAQLTCQPNSLWVIDMAQVNFIDSSGLFALVSGLNAARQKGCHFVICNLKETIRLIFEITQLDRVFEIFESYEAAIANFRFDTISNDRVELVAV